MLFDDVSLMTVIEGFSGIANHERQEQYLKVISNLIQNECARNRREAVEEFAEKILDTLDAETSTCDHSVEHLSFRDVKIIIDAELARIKSGK